MRVSYDPEVDAAFIYLTDQALEPGRDSIPCETPEGVSAIVVMDWKDGKIVGLEVLDASRVLHQDLIAEARPGEPSSVEQRSRRGPIDPRPASTQRRLHSGPSPEEHRDAANQSGESRIMLLRSDPPGFRRFAPFRRVT